ncbi:hypothetical protein [Pseudomonas pseudonitroreducens]|uniref:hypothetical protein n=1 Tax=Pseudomonas pseudonitroreducens TaxID=2892326 RepID=UPI001F2C3949|nr:hypothetical protein [Pseudomonas pseudonitroreducens]
MADDYIYDVYHVARDTDGSLICRCPHCQEIRALDGHDVEDVQGEQYECHCGGWYQIDSDAVRIRSDRELPLNKGVPG